MEIPVYLFTGFLEGGKTRLVQGSMEDPNFNSFEKTLLLVCEDGIEEYNTSLFPSPNVTVVTIENESDMTAEMLSSLANGGNIDRVVIEYNGMWMLDSLYRSLPDNWIVFQEIVVADSTTFENYNANMRSLVADKLQSCDTVIFNRVNANTDKTSLHKTVRGLSTKANIVYEYTDGSIENDDIEDPLPFDVNADVIEIADSDFAIWYRDLVENREKYEGKTVKFKGIIAKDPRNKHNTTSVIGRHVMTCCVNDIAYQGFVFKSPDEKRFKTRDWAIITGKIRSEEHELYNGSGPVIYADSVLLSEKPVQEVATYY